jgi:hypothetical protein
MLPAGILDKLTADRGIAGEVPAKSAGYRAWVQVIVFAIDQETGMARSPSMIDSLLYRVMCFDLPSHLDFHNYEVDDYCEFRFRNASRITSRRGKGRDDGVIPFGK